MYGFAVGGDYTFPVEALDAYDVVRQTDTISAGPLRCGENDVSVELYAFGLIVSVDKSEIAADGEEKAAIKVVARKWKDTDIAEPTGDVIAGKEISFSTTHGTLSATKVVTDANGEASVTLTAVSSGLAVVTASSEGTGEKHVTVDVGSVEIKASARGEYIDVSDADNPYVCARFAYITFVPTAGRSHYRWTVHTHGHNYKSVTEGTSGIFPVDAGALGTSFFTPAGLEARFPGLSALVAIPAGELFGTFGGERVIEDSPDVACDEWDADALPLWGIRRARATAFPTPSTRRRWQG